MSLVSGIRKKPISDPGVKKAPDPDPGSATLLLLVPYYAYKEREEDPMLAYMRKKKEKVSGPVRKMPVYQGPQPPPNRYVK
jgi:hypothetical protein